MLGVDFSPKSHGRSIYSSSLCDHPDVGSFDGQELLYDLDWEYGFLLTYPAPSFRGGSFS